MATTDIYHVAGSLTPAKPALRFLGGAVDDGIQIDAFAAARTAANDTKGTITAWVNMPDGGGTYTIIGVGDANAAEYIHFSFESGKLFAACMDATVMQWDINSTATALTPHKWQHVALVQDGVRPRMYVNGIEVAVTDTVTTDLTEWFKNLDGVDGGHIGAADSIAGDAALTQEYKGAIGAVKYWNTNLTAAQILADYDGVSNTKNLISHWNWEDNNYADIVSGHNGTLVGDVVACNRYSEFSSRMSFGTGIPVVADKVVCFADKGVGHAVVIQAA